MVALPIVRSSNVKTLTSTPTYVAVFIGATAGIGSYGVKSLASSWYNANTSSSKQALPSGRHLRIYIVGRNLSAAEALIAECRQACPEGGDFRFIKADDLALLKDVRKCTGEIVEAEEMEAGKSGEKAKIDQLVMSQGIISFTKQGKSLSSIPPPPSPFAFSLRLFFLSNSKSQAHSPQTHPSPSTAPSP